MIDVLKELDKLIKWWSFLLKFILWVIVVYVIILIVCILFRQEKVPQLLSIGKDYWVPALALVVLGKTNNILDKIQKKLG